MSAMERKSTNGSSFEGVKPRRRQKFSGLVVDGVDHQGPSADQCGSLNATLEGVLDQTRAKAAPHPLRDASELTEKQAGNRLGWLARAN